MQRKTVMLDDETLEKLSKKAEAEQRTISNMIRKIVTDYIQREENDCEK